MPREEGQEGDTERAQRCAQRRRVGRGHRGGAGVCPEKKGQEGTQRVRRGVPREEGQAGDTEGVQGCAQRRRAGRGHRGCTGVCPEMKGRKGHRECRGPGGPP